MTSTAWKGNCIHHSSKSYIKLDFTFLSLLHNIHPFQLGTLNLNFNPLINRGAMVTFMKNRISIYKKYVSFSANISAQIDLDPRHRSQRQKVHRQSSLDISRLQDRFPRNFLFTISPRFHPFFRKHLGSINFPISLTLRARSQSRGVISKEQKRGGD